MAVRAEAEEHEVERLRQLDVPRAKRVNLLLRDRDAIEERLARHPFVRVLVIRRDEPLVAPPDVPGGPLELHTGQPLVGRTRRGAAGQRDPKRVSAAGTRRDPAGRELG
jgi:hypothetical protein